MSTRGTWNGVNHAQRQLFRFLMARLRGKRIGMQRRIPCIFVLIVICFVALWPSTLHCAQAQEIGDDVCGCSPGTFTFTLDFSRSCPPTDIQKGTGVEKTSCLVSPFGAPTDNLSPIVVEGISILELDQVNSVIVEERIDGSLLSGDTFTYTSILADSNSITTARQVPKALQMTLNGRNSEGVVLLNVFIITYSNQCGIFPVIQNGESAGWVVFVSFFNVIALPVLVFLVRIF
mmetsp:Transcript_26790/g.50106  ORF Transcript_26790/g.50106 Transcript_26790/m.50106 type:complete len:233 (+) Transcript_26790:186-884(+)